jgi:hypothetical protein
LLIASSIQLFKVTFPTSGNAQATRIPAGQMVILAGCDEKSAISHLEKKQNCPGLLTKTWQFLFVFVEALHFCLYF